MELSKRMKRYELASKMYLTRKVPVAIRVDGRAFHSLLKNAEKPYDKKFIHCMVLAAKATAAELQGFKVGYIQSDEATFILTDYENLNSDAWFDYRTDKLTSITASLMTYYFNQEFYNPKSARPVVFDARAFSIPREEVSNLLLWRAKDWARNSLNMFAQSLYSHKELHGKKRNDLHEMIHAKGRNWATDATLTEKNGTFLFNIKEGGISESSFIPPVYENIAKIVDQLI